MKLQDLKAKSLSHNMDVDAASSRTRLGCTYGNSCIKPAITFAWGC